MRSEYDIRVRREVSWHCRKLSPIPLEALHSGRCDNYLSLKDRNRVKSKPTQRIGLHFHGIGLTAKGDPCSLERLSESVVYSPDDPCGLRLNRTCRNRKSRNDEKQQESQGAFTLIDSGLSHGVAQGLSSLTVVRCGQSRSYRSCLFSIPVSGPAALRGRRKSMSPTDRRAAYWRDLALP
jgi:hypothetical protein